MYALELNYKNEDLCPQWEQKGDQLNLLAEGVIGTPRGEHELVLRYMRTLSDPSVHVRILGGLLPCFTAESIEDAVNDTVAGLLERYRSEAIVREYLRLINYDETIREMYHAKIWRESRISELRDQIFEMNRDFLRIFENESSMVTYAFTSFSNAIMRYNKKRINIELVDLSAVDGFLVMAPKEGVSLYDNTDFYQAVEDFLLRKFKRRKDYQKLKMATVDMIKGESILTVTRRHQVTARPLVVIRDFIKKYLAEPI